MGKIFRTTFTSSTCCTVQPRFEWKGLFMAALLRKLRVFVGVSMGSVALVSSPLSFSSPSACTLLFWLGKEGLVAMLTMALLGLLMQLFSMEATRTCVKKTRNAISS